MVNTVNQSTFQVHGGCPSCHQQSNGHVNEEEILSFKNWMSYRAYETFTDMCIDLSCILDHIHDQVNAE